MIKVVIEYYVWHNLTLKLEDRGIRVYHDDAYEILWFYLQDEEEFTVMKLRGDFECLKPFFKNRLDTCRCRSGNFSLKPNIHFVKE